MVQVLRDAYLVSMFLTDRDSSTEERTEYEIVAVTCQALSVAAIVN